MNNKRNLLIMIITFSLILVIGSSYAYLMYTKESSNNYVINVGTLEVTFVDSKTQFLNLTDMYPMTDEEGEDLTKELVFQVKNTGNVDSYYDVSIEEVSTSPEFKSVIKYIVNKDNAGYNEPKILGEDKYIEVGGLLKPNEIADYRVKVWLAETADNTYMNKEFKAKVVVNSFQKSDYAKDVIKSKLVKYEESSKEDFSGGLVAVNTDGELYNETDDSESIREYRYSGLNVNNYVTFNNEEWRIIGVFKDESGNEHLKILKNKVLARDMFSTTFVVNETTYIIQSTTIGDYAYWNYITGTSSDKNDWATGGLQFWLNAGSDKETKTPSDGYMSYLNKNAKNMIEKTKYYLGNVVTSSDTAINSYAHERGNKACSGSCSGGDVWSDNSATWIGNIALIYPSDYGYTTSSSNWSSKEIHNYEDGARDTSWIYKNTNHVIGEWFLSPTSRSSYNVANWHPRGNLDYGGVAYGYNVGVRPCLYLKSNVKIISGTGEINNQYQLSI